MFFCLIGLYILSTSNSFLKNIKKVNVFGNKPYPRMERVKMLIEFWITRYKPNLILAVLITSDSGFFTTTFKPYFVYYKNNIHTQNLNPNWPKLILCFNIFIYSLDNGSSNTANSNRAINFLLQKYSWSAYFKTYVMCIRHVDIFQDNAKVIQIGNKLQIFGELRMSWLFKSKRGAFCRNDYLPSSQDTL